MKNYMDISVKSAKNVLKDKRKLLSFLETQQIVEEKLDGLKVNLILKKDASSKKPYTENWIVAYKGNVLYPEEFEYNTDEEAKKSIGSSQFKFIFDTLKQVNVNNLPKGYQFFCEYLVKKPTLMSQYNNLYNLILLSYGKSSYEIKNGMLITSNTNFDFDFDERADLAKKMHIHVPPIVFEGVLYPTKELLKGIKYKELDKAVQKKLEDLQNSENDIELYWKILNNVFLSVKSVFGGKPEGFIFWNSQFPPLKIQQEYQLSKEDRAKVKQKFKADPFQESIYWAEVGQKANELIEQLGITSKDGVDFRSIILKASNLIKKLPEDSITHPKKSWEMIKDDIFLTLKLKLIRMFADKYALAIGKFRVFTNGHKKIIDKALQKYKGVVIALVSSKDTFSSNELRRKVLEECYKKEIKNGIIKIVETRSGNIATILNKALPTVIGGVVAGSDRVDVYKEQIVKIGHDIHVIEIQRDENSISATKVIENIFDEDFFEKNTPKCVWKFYDEYLKIFNK